MSDFQPIIMIILILLIPFFVRLPHLLILIPALRNLRNLALPTDNRNYLLRTVSYLFLGLFISFAFVILLNKGGPFVGSQGNILRNEGFYRWIKTIDRSDFEFADFQFLESLLIFYLSAFLYVVLITFINKKKFSSSIKLYLLNLFFYMVFIILGGFILYLHIPIVFDWGIRPNIVLNLVLFFSMWILFALPATKRLGKHIKTTIKQKKPTEIPL